jgi:hypothetical protein
MKKELGKYHRASFLALPISVEMRGVGTPHRALAHFIALWHHMPAAVKFYYNHMIVKMAIC